MISGSGSGRQRSSSPRVTPEIACTLRSALRVEHGVPDPVRLTLHLWCERGFLDEFLCEFARALLGMESRCEQLWDEVREGLPHVSPDPFDVLYLEMCSEEVDELEKRLNEEVENEA